ncbi:MAG TPA: 50S ribosomal protein L30 [Myxococcaceae bacterium]|nr:50S ribosomal protein L30 [Myxococcaceae bacterium]
MGYRVKLIRSIAGASERQAHTVASLGLRKLGQERLLRDTPATRGMVFRVRHLVSGQVVSEEPKPSVRRKPRLVRAREVARARRAKKEGK